MENRELKLEHLDPLKWLRPPFVWDQCQERRWNIQEKEMSSMTAGSTEIQSFSLALMANCWFSAAVCFIQNFNCWSFGQSPKGCLEAILYECCCSLYPTIFRLIYLGALFRIFDQFTKWVLKQFFPFSTANISTLVSLSCTGISKILTKSSFETHEYSSDVWPMTRPRYTEYFLMGPTLSSQTRSPLWNCEISPSFLFQIRKYMHSEKK